MNDKSLTADYLLESGIVMIIGQINTEMAQSVVAQLQYLDNKYPGRPIQILINSPGGEITAGMAIYDTMNYIRSEVQTIAMGMAASMGAFLLSSGSKGKRCAMPNAEILIHQPLGGASGQASDILIAAKHIENVRSRLNEILSKNTGQSVEQIALDTDRDNVMTPEKAKDYGLIDHIIETTPKAW